MSVSFRMKKNLFSQLYNFCQTLDIPVTRGELIPKAVEIAGAQKIRAIWVDLTSDKIRGRFVRANNHDSQWYKFMKAENVIALSSSLKADGKGNGNKCWERFIFVKEAMHLFDDADESTATPESYEALLQDLENGAYYTSKQSQSDAMAVWMALGCLCPEKNRQDFIEKRKSGFIDNFGIATQLKIPEKHIDKLLSENFSKIIGELTQQ